ncbi:MAG: 50S ribosomal protein L35 [Candidatus Magasanikbacteria bacterium]|nr:50S ribosomal protein L35 [Candidatus Magasanikbacteria bacterium]
MPKLKTHKATAKRFKVKRSKKGVQVIKRTDGQDHFNARESGKTKRNKRSDKAISKVMNQTILRALPFNK